MTDLLLGIQRGRQELPGGLTVGYGNMPAFCSEFSKPHAHDDPYLSFLAHGDCHETIGKHGGRDLKPWKLTFHPKDEVHSRETSRRGYGVFGVAISQSLVEEGELALPERPTDLLVSDLRMQQFALQFASCCPVARLKMSATLLEFLAEMATPISESHIPAWLLRARNILHGNPFTPIPDVAREVSVSAPHLAKEFRRRFHISPAKFVQARILERAKAELLATDAPIASIANQLGFCDESHFVRTFRTHFGQTPGRFRKSLP